MATASFTETLIVKDEKSIKKLKKELDSTKSAYKDIKPRNLVTNTKEVAKIWLNR